MHDLNYCMPDLNYCMPDLNYCGITAELLRNYCGITVKQAELLYARKNSPCNSYNFLTSTDLPNIPPSLGYDQSS